MKNFIQDLKNIACESLNIEDTISVDPYAGMECAEEFMTLDDIENVMVANESFSNALMECAFENQLVALEAAGLNGMNDIRHFNGELSNEAVGNMIKRGAYNIKIQVKKAIGKIWSLIVAGVQYFVGADGRFKSYGKLVKKYADRLSKMNASSNDVDKDEKEVTIRDWKNIVSNVTEFKTAANVDSIKAITGLVKGVETNGSGFDVSKVLEDLYKGLNHVMTKGGTSSEYTNISGSVTDTAALFTSSNLAEVEKIEKDLTDYIKDMDVKSDFQQALDEMKDVDSDSVEISKAQSELLGYARQLEGELKKDIKFKKELGRLKSAWDKAFGKFEIKGSGTNGAIETADKIRAVQVRCLAKLSSLIADWKMMLGKWYGAVASNIQGFLADMAKVLAKGTKVRG